MEDESAFVEKLRQALAAKHESLEATDVPQLKEQFRLVKTSFETVTNILQRKNLLNEDPYKYETKISGVEIPDDSMFGEFERDDQMSIRLSHYDSVLEYVVSYYEFGVDVLDLKALKQLLALIGYIKWDQFNAQVQSPTTRTLTDLVSRLRGGGDNFSVNLINDALEQLGKATRTIKQVLRTVADYHKEAYKLRLRDQLLSRLDLSPADVEADRDSAVAKVRREFAAAMPGEPFVGDLVAEALDEDYSSDSQALHEAVLGKLEVKKATPKRTDRGALNRSLLLEAVHAAAASGRPLLDAVTKLNDNHALVGTKDVSFGDRVRRFLQRLQGGESKTGEYEVEYFDEATGAQHSETIDYVAFAERVTKKAKLYAMLATKASSANRRLEQGTEDQIFDFVNKDLGELHVVHRRLKSLDTYFKSEVARDQRSRLRGIKIELTTIKNHLVKANQKRREYVARKEEEEQLKRLGLQSE